MSSPRSWLFVLQCSIGAAACGSSSGTTCTTDDQCPSHFCRVDGTCGPVTNDAPAAPLDGGSDATSGVCTPNMDGTITAAELPLAAGQSAKFRIATNATWNTAGTSNTDGSRDWDLSGQLSGDADQTLALSSPTGAWWASDYAGASYSAVLSASSNLLGVFAVDSTGVTLLGVVSPTAGSSKTELMYDPPARIVAVPFMAGSTWTSKSTVTGTAEAVPVDYDEEYDSSVDAVGTMKTPYGSFPVLRVATSLTRTEGVVTVLTNKTFSWMAECFGAVATVQSQSNEAGSEFSNDAEVERLAP
ncbi:MAG TPA: hypothetical protein VMJ10_32135 [Kofleriaceae bacterium]|nr:hypothetical protein [Kofleriaceae bacterium]